MKFRDLFSKRKRPAGVDTEIWRLVAGRQQLAVKPPSLLTPNDVRDQVFTTHRFREGYDMDEVDAFLDHVRGTIETIGKAKLKEM